MNWWWVKCVSVVIAKTASRNVAFAFHGSAFNMAFTILARLFKQVLVLVQEERLQLQSVAVAAIITRNLLLVSVSLLIYRQLYVPITSQSKHFVLAHKDLYI